MNLSICSFFGRAMAAMTDGSFLCIPRIWLVSRVVYFPQKMHGLLGLFFLFADWPSSPEIRCVSVKHNAHNKIYWQRMFFVRIWELAVGSVRNWLKTWHILKTLSLCQDYIDLVKLTLTMTMNSNNTNLKFCFITSIMYLQITEWNMDEVFPSMLQYLHYNLTKLFFFIYNERTRKLTWSARAPPRAIKGKRHLYLIQ